MSWSSAATAGVILLGLCSNFSNAETRDAAEQCDRLAAHSIDPTRPPEIPAVDFDKIDSDSAISACQRALAAQPNNARVAYQLGRALDKAGKVDDAITFYTKAAKNGHVKAMVSLGNVYRDDKKDASEAVRWHRKAADAGFSEGLLELGDAYSRGSGVEVNKQEAARLWRRSAEYGDPRGMRARLTLGQAAMFAALLTAILTWISVNFASGKEQTVKLLHSR
jgi:TPR repeat protein